jgi:hypothetical protein
MSLPNYIYERMNEQVLWTLVDFSRQNRDTIYEQGNLLISLLQKYSTKHLLKFENIYWGFMQKSNDADLWAAAYVLNDGCDELSFLHFRNWLLLQGQMTFKKALEDPETLVNYINFENYQSLNFPDLEVSLANLIHKKIGDMYEIPDFKSFELSGELWKTDMDIVDKVPLLCQKMGWGNKVPQGEWKSDPNKSGYAATSKR